MGRRERGSAFLLMPVAILMVLALGAIAIDLSARMTAQRALTTTVESAADDAASAVDLDALRTLGVTRIDPDRARDAVVRHVLTARLPGRIVAPLDVTVSPDGMRVEVVAHMDVDAIFEPSVPGGARSHRVTARASAELNYRP